MNDRLTTQSMYASSLLRTSKDQVSMQQMNDSMSIITWLYLWFGLATSSDLSICVTLYQPTIFIFLL